MRSPDTRGVLRTQVAEVWRSRDARTQVGSDEPTVAAYLIRAPQAHPFWDWHAMAVIHLRDHPKYGKARRVDFEGASHEVLVTALDPSNDRLVDPDNAATWKHMNPHDFVGQVGLGSDDEARRLAELLAFAVADGNLVPDADHQWWWGMVLALIGERVRAGDGWWQRSTQPIEEGSMG